MNDPIGILMEHVLLTSRHGFAACAAENCEWEDKFARGGDQWGPVPVYIRSAHARHQLDLLAEAGYEPQPEPPQTPRGGW